MKRLTCIIAIILLSNVFGSGIFIEITNPSYGEVFHVRNITFCGYAEACCNDKLVKLAWTHQWDNGSISDEMKLDFITYYEFRIDILLYPGKNLFEITANSYSGNKASAKVEVYYDGPLADANGPYYGYVLEEINFDGFTYGGSEPYIFLWDFGDGCVAYEKNPRHSYISSGFYNISFKVTDSNGYSDINHTFAVISKREENPPVIEITNPKNWIYINGNKIIPFFIPLIVGSINIEANAYDDTGISSVEFYMDENLLCKIYSPPYSFEWSGNGYHEIEAIAYDLSMNKANCSINLLAI
ncbi:MAG: PKD domain-containing protein [Thermoplasmatales archaeon]|nr:PKD domain-containing protein [Thermoplasmatales archaeon]